MTEQPYLAGGATWIYPHEQMPPLATKILVLTRGGIAHVGHWMPGDLAWHPLPKRDKAKEDAVHKSRM